MTPGKRTQPPVNAVPEVNSTLENLNELVGIFTKEDYPPNENNISSVPFDDVFAELTGRFGDDGFSYEIVDSGLAVNGKTGLQENYVAVKLTVPFKDGTITRSGAAQGKIGMSGLLGVAVVNAALRHLGMGTELYQHEEGEEPNFDNNQPNRVATSAVPQRQVYGNKNQNNTPGPRYREWDGQLVIRSGQYANTKWADVDLNGLQNMVNKGNNMASKEMERREAEGLVPRVPFQ